MHTTFETIFDTGCFGYPRSWPGFGSIHLRHPGTATWLAEIVAKTTAAYCPQDIHKELEGSISKFHGTDDTILYPSCFDANAGLFEAILDNRDAVISDQLNHASIIDGIRLCKAERHRYNHLDMLDLEEKLKATQHARVRLIATDGVFSMDGDVAPLKYVALRTLYSRNTCQLARK